MACLQQGAEPISAQPGFWARPSPGEGAAPNALALATLARFHALHWEAVPVLEQVYPWLPRFSEWVTQHSRFLTALLVEDMAPQTPYGQRILSHWPDLAHRFATFWHGCAPEQVEPLQALLRNPTPLLDRLAASPQTILHGNWQREELERRGERLTVSEWRYVQVGPAAWDLCTFLHADPNGQPDLPPTGEALSFYLDQVATVVHELSDADRARFRYGFDLCRVLDLLMHPRRWELFLALPTQAAQARWISELSAIVSRLIGAAEAPKMET